MSNRDDPDAVDHDPTDEDAWAGPPEERRPSLVRAFLPLIIGGGLAAAAWYASGDYFSDKARQTAADRWDELRVCLLGDALKPGDTPSERVRFIRLAAHTTDDGAAWPQRCEPYARQLDKALAARSVVMEVGPLPSAEKIVQNTDDDASREDLDLLFGELEMADLPLPENSVVVPAAPAPAVPRIAQTEMRTIGKVLELSEVAAALDPSTGRALRILLPEAQPATCHFNGGDADKRWTRATCETSPLTVARDARLSLSPTDEGGLDLIRVRDSGDSDGIYDARTGLLVLQARYFDTQTHVDENGQATILYAKLRGKDRREEVEHFRLLRTRPGKRPETRRLRLPKTCKPTVAEKHVLWTIPGDRKTGDALIAQALPSTGSKRLGAKIELGALPTGSRYLSRCTDGDTTALLFGAGLEDKHYALVMHGPDGFAKPTDIGTIAGHVTMTCHDDKAMLQRIQHQRVSRWQCTTEGCEIGLSDPLPMLESKVFAVTPIGDEVAVAWKDDRGALRLRVAVPDALAATADTVVLDEWQHGGIEMASLRFVAGGGLAVLLAQDVGRRVYGLRIDASGNSHPIDVSR